MSLDYWYDYGSDYGYSDLSVDGMFGSLFGGFGSLFDGLFYDDYSYSDYGYGYDDYGYGDVLSVGGLLDGLLGGDYGYDYGYDDYGYGDVLSVDDGLDALSGLDGLSGLDLSSVLGLLGGSGLDLSVDGGMDLSSVLGLLGGSDSVLNIGLDGELASSESVSEPASEPLDSSVSETTISVDGSALSGGLDLSSILGLLGGSGDASSLTSILGLLGGGSSSSLTSILGLLGGSGTTLTAGGLSNLTGSLGNLMSIYSGIANLENTDSASWESLSFLDDFGSKLPNVSGSTVSDSSSMLSTVLGLLGGNTGTAVSVDGGTAATSATGVDLSSILGLLGGNTGTSLSVDGLTGGSFDLTSILGLLGGNTGTSLSVDGLTGGSLDLTSILGLLGGNTGTSLSVDGLTGGSLDLTSILGLLGGSGSFDLSSILGLLGGNTGTSLSVDGAFDLSPIFASVLGMLEDFDLSLSFSDDSFGALTVELPDITALETLSMSIPGLTGGDEAGFGYCIEIARGDVFDDVLRMFTTGSAFDIDGSAGAFSCRASILDGGIVADAVEWIAEAVAPRRIISNANGLADIFFASPVTDDIWSSGYRARNAVTGDIVMIRGKNRIRDTFSGSDADANILCLTDDTNGDALFVDDIYSEFGTDARLELIREIRCGAGSDVIDMTSDRYAAKLAGLTVRGGSGNDVLWGAKGGNLLFGDDGWDRIVGGSGDDVIAGGAGDDVLNGGGGDDLFAFGENWGDDVVSQLAGGSVTLWFMDAESNVSALELNGDVIFRAAAGTSSVTVKNAALADLTVRFGDDGSAQFAQLSSAGAFLGSTADSIFEKQSAASGVLASL